MASPRGGKPNTAATSADIDRLERVILELSAKSDQLEKDVQWWAATATDYKRDLGELVRKGPHGVAFEVVTHEQLRDAVEYMASIEKVCEKCPGVMLEMLRLLGLKEDEDG